MSRADWVWMPHPGHLIVGNDCRFHLNTKVGGYIISTVGEYLPDSNVRDVLADCRGWKLEGIGDARRYDWLRKNGGYEDIGHGRKYETMVFHAKERTEDRCCPWSQDSGNDLESAGYNAAEDAYEGHLAMCKKYDALWDGASITRLCQDLTT